MDRTVLRGQNLSRFAAYLVNMGRVSAHSALSVAVAAVLFSGIVSITIPSTVFTTIGVILIIVGLMGLMPIVRLGLSDDPSEVLEFR